MSALQAAAGWLADSAVDLAVLLGLLLVLDRVLAGRLGPRVRYWMWALLLARMLLPALPPDPLGWKTAPAASAAVTASPGVQERPDLPAFPASRQPSPPSFRRDPAPPTSLQGGGTAMAEAGAPAAAEDVASASGTGTPRGRVTRPEPPAEGAPATAADQAAVARAAESTASGLAAQEASDRGSADLLPGLLAALWLAGAVLLLARLGVQEARFRAALRRDARPAPADVQRLLDEVRRRAGMRRPVAALVTDAVPAPAVYGVLRPRLLLPPAALARLDTAELRHVVGHEVAHLRAGDTLLCWLLAVARALHWYHPAAWLGLRRLRAAQEVLRDYQALGAQPDADPRRYAATVLKLGAPPPLRPQPSPLPAILEDGKDLKRRIQMIVDFPLPRRGATLLGTCLLAGIGWAGLTTAASMPGPTGDAADAQEPQLKKVRVVRQDPVPAWQSELLARLETPVTVETQGAPLEDLLDAVRSQAGVNVVVEPDAASEVGPFDFQVRALPARQVLDMVCGDELDWGLAPGVVMLGWEAAQLSRHDLRFYAVEELLDGEDEEWQADELQELISTLSWRLWGTEYASMQYWNGLLVVHQTERGHQAVEGVLDMLLNRGRRAPAATPEWRRELDAKLAETVDVDFDEQGFAAVVRSLSERTGVPMYVHPDNDDGQMLTLRLEGLPLGEVLDWVARQTWTYVTIEEGMVRFTGQPPTEVRMYEVTDLLRDQDGDPASAADQLIDLIQSGTGWSAWQYEDTRIEHWDGLFVVVHTAETHARVERFLGALREAL